MSFAITPKAKGDEEKMAAALRRLHEEDPTLTLRRDEQTGEQLLGGLSQIHVEVAVDRLRRRFGVEVDLHQPRVPYLETIRKESRAQGRYKKQTGGRGQFGDCQIVLEPLSGHEGYEFVDKIVGGVIPQSFRPAVDKGIQEAMLPRRARRRARHRPPRPPGRRLLPLGRLLRDGVQDRRLDGVQDRLREGRPRAPRADHVARGGRPRRQPWAPSTATSTRGAGACSGMEPSGSGMTTIKAEVPMADVLTYSQSLTSLTGGRGDYTLAFLRYEEVPTHIAQKVMEEAKKEREE